MKCRLGDNPKLDAGVLLRLAEDDTLLEVGRKSIEDALVEFRDSRISILGAGNGLVIRERDGRDSDIIRLSPHDALRIGLRAIAVHLSKPQAGGGA